MNDLKPKISMIAALNQNRVIGRREGGIPWHLPRDSRHFREYTAGKFMLLGRTTFEEMAGWFTTQTPIVLTSQPEYTVEGGFVADSIAKAVVVATERGAAELVVSGGASVYEAALSFADELVLTLIDAAEVEGDCYFPDYEAVAEWESVSQEIHPADEENEYSMTFVTLRRKHQ